MTLRLNASERNDANRSTVRDSDELNPPSERSTHRVRGSETLENIRCVRLGSLRFRIARIIVRSPSGGNFHGLAL